LAFDSPISTVLEYNENFHVKIMINKITCRGVLVLSAREKVIISKLNLNPANYDNNFVKIAGVEYHPSAYERM
jgi:hypothetical protein